MTAVLDGYKAEVQSTEQLVHFHSLHTGEGSSFEFRSRKMNYVKSASNICSSLVLSVRLPHSHVVFHNFGFTGFLSLVRKPVFHSRFEQQYL